MTAAQPYRSRHSAPDLDDAPAAPDAPPTPVGRPPRPATLGGHREPEPGPAAEPAADLTPEPAVEPAFEPEPAAEPAAEPAPVKVARPSPRPDASWAAAQPPPAIPPAIPAAMPTAAVPPAPAPQPQPQEWVAYTPPLTPPATQSTGWETPAGFVPLRPPRRSNRLRLVGIAVAVALLGGLGWFGYQAIAQHHSTPTALSGPDVGPASAVSYTSPDGHFRVGLSAQPRIVTQTTTLGGYSFKVTIAADPVGRVAAGGVTVSPDAPADGMASMLRGFVSGLQNDGTVTDVAMSTFQGHPSVTATLTKSTGSEVVLAYAYSPSRMYMLIAADQAGLSALESRFQPLP